MSHFIKEMDNIVRNYRERWSVFESQLVPQLPNVSNETKEFIIEFIAKWDEAIREGRLLSSYDNTADELNRILNTLSALPFFTETILYNHIHCFLYMYETEIDNDWLKAKAESVLLSDIEVLHFCYDHWNDMKKDLSQKENQFT